MTAPLTDTEINERLAKMMGWHKGKWFKKDAWFEASGVTIDVPLFMFYVHTEEMGINYITWHPASSLDQMHDYVEERIIELGLAVMYAITLFYDVLGGQISSDGVFQLTHATAYQKAEAAYKVSEEVGK